jgi:UDPglucose 6-dehydrogenase
LRILQAVDEVNAAQKHVLVDKIVRRYGEDLSGRCFALWGLAFKPNTDDMREAPSRVIVGELVRRGATVRAYDPVAMEEARRCLELDFGGAARVRESVTFASDPMNAALGADALVVVTEWKAFRSPDLAQLKSALKEPVIFDGRNQYDPRELAEAGLVYQAIGRGIRPAEEKNARHA